MPVQFQLCMLPLVVGNGRHIIKVTSTGSAALDAPSSALLMAKAAKCVHAHGVCALQSSSCCIQTNACELGVELDNSA